MKTSEAIDSNIKLICDTIDNASSELGSKITELINEVRALRMQVTNAETTELEPAILKGYVLAKDSDFKWKEDEPCFGAWHYIGKDDKVIIPHTIQGQKVTSYRGMFYGTSVRGVYSDNPNITDMSWMFCGSHAKSLDLSNLETSNVTNMSCMFHISEIQVLNLSNFNTSNVTDMESMFYGSRVINLDLSNFDTSKVTNMRYMFADSIATTLDLSSFDTSNIPNMEFMFYTSKATRGYARSTSDADRFRTSTCKPLELTIIVKSSES